ncbi:MAG TPA: hypothetical protein VK003_19600 [Oceanobacillus sp.]|nr:hypothetical protein [Oceanobacillus sp.]
MLKRTFDENIFTDVIHLAALQVLLSCQVAVYEPRETRLAGRR